MARKNDTRNRRYFKSLNMKRFIIPLLIPLVISALTIACQKNQVQSGNATVILTTIGNTTTETYGVVGVSLYHLLRSKHEVKLTTSGFLKCIDKVCSNSEMSWTIYKNNSKINAGVTFYIVLDSDQINVVYE